MHRGVVQPQEKQAAAHRQPWQEDHHCRRMVSTVYIVVFVFVLWSVNLMMMVMMV